MVLLPVVSALLLCASRVGASPASAPPSPPAAALSVCNYCTPDPGGDFPNSKTWDIVHWGYGSIFSCDDTLAVPDHDQLCSANGGFDLDTPAGPGHYTPDAGCDQGEDWSKLGEVAINGQNIFYDCYQYPAGRTFHSHTCGGIITYSCELKMFCY
ncbi:hypothetical protein VTK56DRAFT_2000 [Thermocarpiscus australiensis]